MIAIYVRQITSTLTIFIHSGYGGVGMFAVKICVHTDGDFSFNDPEFGLKGDKEYTFYFESRKVAAKALVRSFHNLKKSIHIEDREYVTDWINYMDQRIDLIAKKVYTFTIDRELGNQEIRYELVKVHRKDMSNGSFFFDEDEVDIDFSWIDEEKIDWDEVAKIPDVKIKEE